MKISPRTEGSSLLLDLLQKSKHDELENKDIKKVMNHADIKRWLEAYGGSDKVYEVFKESLLSIDRGSSSERGFWGEKIDQGFRKAVDDLEQMRENIREIKSIDWESVVVRALKYLPEDTELEPEFIVTVDGFNGGMFKNRTVFLSIIYFDKSQFRDESFVHEFHHMGAEYWFEKNSTIKQYEKKDKKNDSYLISIIKYLVSEGLANAFCSLGAIIRNKAKDEESKRYNQKIKKFEDNKEELFLQLENLIEEIITGTDEDIIDLYEDFTLDKEGVGIPPGHFLSGRMVMTMKESQSLGEDEIINLVKNPFELLKLYNKAAEDLDERKFSTKLIEKMDDLLDRH